MQNIIQYDSSDKKGKPYANRHLKELKKYKNIFKDDKKFVAIYEIINSIVNPISIRKLSIKEVSEKIGYPAHKINYWLRQYKQEGISALIDYEYIVIDFLKHCGKPISKWTKGSLYEYVNSHGIVINDEKIKVTRSETFYFNILKKMKGWPDTDYSDIINKTYSEQKDNNYQTIYIDYIKVPGDPSKPFSRPTYFYIIVSKHELLIKKVNIPNGTMKYLNIDIEVFSEIMEFLSTSSYEKIMVILNDNEINRVIAEVYSKTSKKVILTIGISSNLHEGLQQGLKYLNDIKNDIKLEPGKLETGKKRSEFIEKKRRKYKDIKLI